MGDLATSPPIGGLDLTPPLTLAVVLACVALGLYLLRAQRRLEQRRARRQVGEFMRCCLRFMRGEIDDHALHQALKGTPEGEFWTALERLSIEWRRREWLALSSAVERNPFAPDERRALRHDSPWRQVLAARRLGLLRSKANRRALRSGVTLGPELVTFASAQALARYRDLRALAWLLEHPHTIARRPHVALVALLRGFGPHARPALLAALDGGVSAPRVERALIEVLGSLGERGACASIEQRLLSPHLDLRVAAARALGRLRAAGAADGLLAALADDAWQVRAQAARALGEAGVRAALQPLSERLTDPAWWVRRHAAYALAELGADGHAVLRTIVEHSPDPFARDIAREVLDGGPRLGAA